MKWILVVTICHIIQMTWGKGIIFLEFVEFTNPSGEGANGHCCDGRWSACQRNGCDHYFHICLTETGGAQTGCLTTDPTRNENRIVFQGSVGDVDNPVQIVKHDLVTDYNLRISVYDYDRFSSDDYVDTLRTHLHFNFSSIVSQTITLSSRTSLRLIAWYECADGFYDCETCGGPELCTQYCVEPLYGNGYCDFYGSVVCFEGWTGSDCSEPTDGALDVPTTQQREQLHGIT